MPSLLEIRTLMDLFTLLILMLPTCSWWWASSVFKRIEKAQEEGANVDIVSAMKIQSGWISLSCVLTGMATAYLYVINPP